MVLLQTFSHFYTRQWFVIVLFLGYAIGGAGCYEYTPAPAVLLGETFRTGKSGDAVSQQLSMLALLTLPKARELALLGNPDLQTAWHNVNAARMRYYQSLGAYAPQISASVHVGQGFSKAGHRKNPPSDLPGGSQSFQIDTSVQSSYLLFDGLARYLSVRIAQREEKLSSQEYIQIRCMLKRAVAYAYFDWQQALRVEEIQRENIAFQEKLLAIVLPEPRRPEDERLNFLIFRDLGKVALLEAQNNAAQANYVLSQLIGSSEGSLPETLHPENMPRQLGVLYYSLDTCVAIALQNNPAFRIAAERMEIARLSKFRSYSAFFPTIYANLQYTDTQWNAHYRDFAHSSSQYGNDVLSYGIQAEYLLFDGFARYNAMREAQSLFAAAEYALASSYLLTVQSIEAAYQTYQTALAQFELYSALLEPARRQRDLVEERYRQYHVSVDRMDKVQEYYVTILVNHASSATQVQKAVAQLEALMMVDLKLQSSD